MNPSLAHDPAPPDKTAIHGLKPYPAYKDSGVAWLGKVPEYWRVRFIKAFLREKDTRSGSGLGTLLSLTRAGGVIPQAEASDRIASAEDLSKYKQCCPGDLVMNRMQAWSGMFATSSREGLVSPDYCVFEAMEPLEMTFFEHLFKSPALVDEFARRSRGIGSGFNRLYTADFGSIAVGSPPISEQSAIARFIRYADGRIRRYIAAKQKLIQLLEEQKQIIIHRAVTRGLDPSVRLKPSGVEWLGEVPHHWRVMPMRRVTLARCDGPFGSGLKSAHYTDDGVRVVRLQNIGHGEFRIASASYVSAAHCASLGDHSVLSGDILIAGLGDERHPAGRACVAPADIEPAMVKADCFRFRINSACVRPRFVALHLTATAAAASAILSTGATRQRTNLESTSARAIAIPPLEEQQLIVDHIEKATAPVNQALDSTRGQIAILREYRTRLIADVVTGKLDVREAAASLPDESGEPEPQGDVDVLPEDEDGAIDEVTSDL